MTTRERRQDDGEQAEIRPAGEEKPPQAPNREAGDAFLDAADAAIERALSGRAEEFLRQNRQLGGQ